MPADYEVSPDRLPSRCVKGIVNCLRAEEPGSAQFYLPALTVREPGMNEGF